MNFRKSNFSTYKFDEEGCYIIASACWYIYYLSFKDYVVAFS